MTDYISRQELLDDFGFSEKTRKYGGDHSGYDTMMLYEIQDVIEDITAADVRPVVLCKDCRYCPSGTDGPDLEFPYEELFKCPFECDDRWYSRKPRPDFFCANGEPKNEGEDR